MKKMNIKILGILTALLIFGMYFTSCEKEGEQSSGKLQIQLTDAPFPLDLVTEANVTISKIEIREKIQNDEDGNPFITLSEEEMSFNLLELTNGVTANLVDLELEAGSYDLVRLYVSKASIKLSSGNEYEIHVPSGDKTGIKIFIDPYIEVTGGLTSELLLDLDVSKSFLLLGNLNSPAGVKGFIFKPVIKASNLSTAGRLTGMVTDTSNVAIGGTEVSVIVADTVYTTSFTDLSGAYTLLGLDADKYIVEFAKEGYQNFIVEDVEIVAGNATKLDAELIPNGE